MEKFLDYLKKLGKFLGLFAYAVGSLGGFGLSLYAGEVPIAIAVAVLAGMAFPTAEVTPRRASRG